MSKLNELQKSRENFQRKEKLYLLRDWYGEDFANVEIFAYTPQPRPLSASLNKILAEMKAPEVGKFIRVEKDWEKIVGPQWARFTHPAELTEGVLVLEVPHSALIPELKPSLDLILQRIQGKLGKDFCSEIRLTISGSRRRKHPAGSR